MDFQGREGTKEDGQRALVPGRRHGAYQVQRGTGAYDGGMTSNVQRSGGLLLARGRLIRWLPRGKA